MFRRTVVQQFLAWILLLIVAAIFISPAVDLDACTLRTQTDVAFLFWLLAAALFLLVLRIDIDVRSRSIRLVAVAGDITWIPPALSTRTLSSVWRT
jgi:hypothetical protein